MMDEETIFAIGWNMFFDDDSDDEENIERETQPVVKIKDFAEVIVPGMTGKKILLQCSLHYCLIYK
jgi:hypothetical protein